MYTFYTTLVKVLLLSNLTKNLYFVFCIFERAKYSFVKYESYSIADSSQIILIFSSHQLEGTKIFCLLLPNTNISI